MVMVAVEQGKKIMQKKKHNYEGIITVMKSNEE